MKFINHISKELTIYENTMINELHEYVKGDVVVKKYNIIKVPFCQ